MGVTAVDWVLHTHHHRDQCWGTPGFARRHAARVAVPQHERYLFDHATEHWATKRIFDNYNVSSTFFAPSADIRVDAVLRDYDVFSWGDMEFSVVPAPGHTSGSIALVAEIDQQRVAFTGDLLTAGGYVYQLHSLEYAYGDMVGVLHTIQSLQALKRLRLDVILPSHGPVILDVPHDLDALERRLMDIVRLGSIMGAAGLAPQAPEVSFLPCPALVCLSEHLLWSGPWACANFYVLLSGTGEALLVDYGHAFYGNEHIGQDQQAFEYVRFVEHHTEELRERFGVREIEVVIATHIHDDHVCGIPYLQRNHGTECWALEEVAKVLVAPADWAGLPCVYPEPIDVHRRLRHGEAVEWRGYTFTFWHAPGQTEFHSVISAAIDGKVVAFTGDNYVYQDVMVGGVLRRTVAQPTIFRNSFQLAMHRQCAEVMQRLAPQLVCPGHNHVLRCDCGTISEYSDFIQVKEQVLRAAVAEPAEQYVDVAWARIRPYFTVARPGSSITFTLDLRNNVEHVASYSARLLGPEGWKCAGERASVVLAAGGHGEVSLIATAPEEGASGRQCITAEVFIDDESQGPVAEAVVEIRGERA